MYICGWNGEEGAELLYLSLLENRRETRVKHCFKKATFFRRRSFRATPFSARLDTFRQKRTGAGLIV